MQIGKHLPIAVIGLVLVPPATPSLRADTGIGRSIVQAPVTLTRGQETSSTGASVLSQSQPVPFDAPPSAYGIDVPLAYYSLSFTLSKRTGGITPTSA